MTVPGAPGGVGPDGTAARANREPSARSRNASGAQTALSRICPTGDEIATVWTLCFAACVYYIAVGALTLLPRWAGWVALPIAAAVCLVALWPLLKALWRGEAKSFLDRRVLVATSPYEEPKVRSSVRAVGYTFVVWALAVILFAAATDLIEQERFDRIAGEDALFDGFSLAGHVYVWHLVDALPAIKATEVLGWKEPATERHALTSVLIMFYRAAVLAPIIAALHGVFFTRQAVASAAVVGAGERAGTRH